MTTHSAAAADDSGVIRTEWSSRLGGAEPKAKIELSGPVLRMMTAAAGRAAEFGDLVEQLQLVRVEVYEDLGRVDTTTAAQEKAAQLGSENWQSVVRVREDGESVDVMVLPQGDDVIAGVAILVAEEGELVFVNVAGQINAEEFGEKFGQVIGPLMQGELELEDLLAVEEHERHERLYDDDGDDDGDDEDEDE